MSDIGITPHESFALHETIVFKTLAATKALTLNALVKDEELKEMLIEDGNMAKKHVKELKELLLTSPYLSEDNDE